MTRQMFDSTVAADIPGGSELIGGYVDGTYKWPDSDWLLFPGRILVRICIFSNRLDAHVIDCEEGNNDAAGVVPWIKGKWDRGEVPTVYCYTDLGPVGYRISDVRAACDAAGVGHPQFLVAHYDNIQEIPAGCIGKQYANPTFTGGHYDASIVADFWPGVDAPGGTMTDAQMAELKAYISAQTTIQVNAAIAIALRQMRGANPGLPGNDQILVAGERIFQSDAK